MGEGHRQDFCRILVLTNEEHIIIGTAVGRITIMRRMMTIDATPFRVFPFRDIVMAHLAGDPVSAFGIR